MYLLIISITVVFNKVKQPELTNRNGVIRIGILAVL